MNVKESAIQIIQDVRVGGVVATATTGTGIGTVLEWIPDDIGKLAVLVGIILSSILIFSHLLDIRMRLEKRAIEKKGQEASELVEDSKAGD